MLLEKISRPAFVMHVSGPPLCLYWLFQSRTALPVAARSYIRLWISGLQKEQPPGHPLLRPRRSRCFFAGGLSLRFPPRPLPWVFLCLERRALRCCSFSTFAHVLAAASRVLRRPRCLLLSDKTEKFRSTVWKPQPAS